MRVIALLLAAGFGRRFGSDKRLFQAPDEFEPLLLRTARRYRQVFDTVLITLRPDDDRIRTLLRETEPLNDLHCIDVADAAAGMSRSISAGARWVQQQAPAAPALCIGLADMPYVLPDTLRQLQTLALNLGPEAIIRPVHAGQPGQPVVFGSSWLNELQSLQGDQGARVLLTAHPDAVHLLPVQDPGVLQDIDRPADAVPLQ